MALLSREQLYFSYIVGDLFFSKSLNEFIDYFKEENIKELLTLYKDTLSKKNITTAQELMKVIRIDFEKMIYALLEVKSKNSLQIIYNCFGKDQNKILDILTKLEGKNLYHFGFEINQPMDLIMYSFKYWINKFNQYFSHSGTDIKIIKFFRFSASKALQQRVNTYVEIMRLWIEFDGREEMLELFDIHRPVSILQIQDQPSLDRLLTGDDIWHYAIYLDHADEVEKLHEYFKILTAQNDLYELPFQTTVNNKHDSSLYTKIINKDKKIELEFVTKL